jgi:hypothetical protein
MKLSAFISLHYMVYVGLTMLVSATKLNNPFIVNRPLQTQEVKQDATAHINNDKLLHSELLFKF